MENKRKYPTFFEQLKSAGKLSYETAKTFIREHELRVDNEVKERRLKICYECEHFNKEDKRCYLCGCFMETKTELLEATCPALKW